jgi:hypothetical protein
VAAGRARAIGGRLAGFSGGGRGVAWITSQPDTARPEDEQEHEERRAAHAPMVR